MADLHLASGDTRSDGTAAVPTGDDGVHPPARSGGSRPWDRRGATAADRGVLWEPQGVESSQYPTRMARRRALEAAHILDGWHPDPVLTPPLLQQVGEELLRLFDDGVQAETGAQLDAQ
ncbi:MAG TPA: hypothetical protein VFL94_11580, partial [Actinomycetales bacterium]|nr:hypothetical protein [Actinomycetales bacterium]